MRFGSDYVVGPEVVEDEVIGLLDDDLEDLLFEPFAEVRVAVVLDLLEGGELQFVAVIEVLPLADQSLESLKHILGVGFVESVVVQPEGLLEVKLVCF